MSNYDDKPENKELFKQRLFDKLAGQISVGNYQENASSTDISITKSDLSYKQNHPQLSKKNNVSIQRYKSGNRSYPQLNQKCPNRVTFIDQTQKVPFASITLIESYKKYNSQNTYDSFASSDDSKKSNCCILI